MESERGAHIGTRQVSTQGWSFDGRDAEENTNACLGEKSLVGVMEKCPP